MHPSFLRIRLSSSMAIVATLLAGVAAVTVPAATIRLQNGLGYSYGTYNGAEDTYLSQPRPDASGGKLSYLRVGYEVPNQAGSCRALVRFNLSSLNSALTTISQVTSAKLTLRLTAVGGAAVASKTVYLYTVSDANKSWSSGTNTQEAATETGAACWNWRAYDNTNFAPSDPVNCPNPTAGCPRRNPWAGDVPAYTATWPNLTNYKGGGCGISATDYAVTPVASAIVSAAPTDGGMQVEFAFVNPSIFLGLIQDNSTNTGFLIACPDLEVGSRTSYSTLEFASCDYPSTGSRPTLTLEISPFNAPLVGINYSLPSSGNVSLHISDSVGKVVKELLFAAPRTGGSNSEYWDCKDDPRPQRNDTPATVPDGKYTVKILQTQGLSTEYICNVGTSGAIWREDQFPGNHVTPGGIAVDSANALYIGSSQTETTVALRKQDFDGNAIWVDPSVNGFDGCHALAVMDNKLYGITVAGTYNVLPADRAIADGSGATRVNVDTVGLTGPWRWDIAARKGHVLVANYTSKSICWITPATGLKIGAPMSVPDLAGIAIDLNGDAIILDGTTLKKYAFGATTPTVVASALPTVSKAYRMEIHPTSGDIYVLDYGTMQVKIFTSAGVLKRALGRVGGRGKNGYGKYDPTEGFYHGTDIVTPDIAIARDGSFFVAEQEPMRRVAHYDSLGKFIKEWYGPCTYAPHSVADPDDPRIVWVVGNYYDVYRCQVDYLAQTWKVLGVYRTTKGSFTYRNGWAAWNIVKRGGKTYLVAAQFPHVMYFDEAADSLRFVASGGYGKNSWCFTCTPQGMLPNGNFDFTTNVITGTCADLDGDGEIAWSTNENIDQPAGKSYSANCCDHHNGVNAVDSNFVVYGNLLNGGTDSAGYGNANVIPGPAVYRPREIRTINGAAVPIWDLADLSFPFMSNRKQIVGDMAYWWPSGGGTIDGKGGVYSAYNYGRNNPDTSAVYSATKLAGTALVKGDLKTGKIMWAVGQYQPSTGSPAAGQFSRICHMLGTFRNCVAVADVYPVQYVYDEDGLYAGRFYDTKLPKNGKALPSFTTCGEQFGGSVFEVKRDDIPGLAKKDVIFLSAADNTVAIMRIHGFDNFVKMHTTITVHNGAIVGQSAIINDQSSEVATSFARPKAPEFTVSPQGNGCSLVKYAVGTRSRVKVEVFSALGRKVATLVDGTMEPGAYTATLNRQTASGRCTGAMFYIVRLSVGGNQVTRQMVLF